MGDKDVRYFLLLIFPLSVSADISGTDLVNAAHTVGSNMIIQCNGCVITDNPDGTRHMTIGNIMVYWKMDGKHFCSTANSFSFFENIMQPKSVLEAMATSGKIWIWNIGETTPIEADPWCTQ